jgi:hypothetical protein
MKHEHSAYITVEWVNGIRCPLCAAYENETRLHAGIKEAEQILKRVLLDDSDLDFLYTRSLEEEIGRWLENYTDWRDSPHGSASPTKTSDVPPRSSRHSGKSSQIDSPPKLKSHSSR